MTENTQPSPDENKTPADELLALLLAEEGYDAAPTDSILPRPPDQPAPLSFAQRRLWFLDQLEPHNPAYNIPTAVIRLQGQLDVAALRQSLTALIERHESLRTTFPTRDDQPVQQINPPNLTLPLTDLSHLPETERLAQAEEMATAEARQPFDLTEGPLFRARLLHLSPTDHQLLWTIHHIVGDGWSLGLFYRELATLYRAFVQQQPNPLPPLPIQYADFAAWQRRQAAEGRLADQLAYWRQQLADAPPVLPLPLDHPRPVDSGSHPSRRRRFKLPADLSEALEALSRQENATLFMTLLATFKVLLFRYTRQADINVGTSIANRNRQDIEPLLGFFVNTLVLRTDLTDRPTFRQLLARVRQTALAAYAHQDVPFEQLVEQLQPERDVSLTPLFQVMFTLQNAPMPPLDLPDLTMTVRTVDSGTAKFDLELEIIETPTGLAGSFEYDATLFEAATIERLVGHWQTLLTAVVAAPDTPITHLSLLTPAEAQQLLVDFNRTERDFPLDTCFMQQFEAQVEKTPDAIAVTCEETSLTYRQLNAQANRLAHQLAAHGVGPEVVVALLAERGLTLLTMILAVFKAGGAYLPLDPLHPPSRHRHIISQSRTPLLLAAAEFLPRLEEALAEIPAAEQPALQAVEPLLAAAAPDHNPPPRAVPNNLAYVIYTSGSTGRPKGAMVTHIGMINHLWSKIEDLNLTAADKIGQNASQCFDISVWQFLAALLVGGETHIFVDEVAHDPPRLLAEVSRRRLTIFQVVPSLLRAILESTTQAGAAGPPLDLAALRWVVPTGEALTTELARQWLARYPNIPLLNAYGSTECSDDQCHHAQRRLPPPDFHLPTIPIGKAMANVQMYILDEALNPTPLGVAGELYVGGIGVGRGYLHDPRRTAEAFIPNPFLKDEGGRMKDEEAASDSSSIPRHSSLLYKTGDLGRYLPDVSDMSDGTIEFLGRVDFMVKIRGFRIELGEIEAALAGHPDIREAVVLARADGNNPEDKYLAAYIVAQTTPAPAVAALRGYLKERLPEYMLPTAFVMLESMPLNNNGKINRRALPQPEIDRSQATGSYTPPTTPVEQVLARLWAEVLNLERVGLHDDFFELGGHSLLATQLIFKVRQAFQVDLPLRDFFRATNVAALAELVEARRRGHVSGQTMIDFEAEAVLPADIQPTGRAVATTTPEAIFMTGATGFLGAFLLAELLEQTSAQIVCLVRAKDDAAARQRLVDNLRRYRLWHDDFTPRLTPLVGDLAAPRFGLSELEFAALAGQVQAIVHNGALVNFVYPYEQLKPVNVNGTLTVLRLATLAQPLPLHYVSTVSVFDSRPYFDGRTIYETERPAHPQGLLYGYAQSKWVAERLVGQAAQRGLPVAIYRPGTVVGDSRTGVWNVGDYLSRLLTGCLALGQAPVLDQHLNLAPVDYVSRALVALLRRPESLGGIFHLVSPHEISWLALLDLLAEAGYPLPRQPYPQWQAALIEAGSDNPLYAMLPLFVEWVSPDEAVTLIELLEQEPRYDARRTIAALADNPLDWPPLDVALAARYMDYLTSQEKNQ